MKFKFCVGAVVLCFLLTACGGAPSAAPPESVPPVPAASDISAPPAAPETPDSDDMLAKMVRAVAPVVEEIAVRGEDEPVLPELKEKLLAAAESQGEPVVHFGTLDAGHTGDFNGLKLYQPMVDFCGAWKAGRDARTAFYEVDRAGVAETVLTAKDGGLTCVERYWACADSAPDPRMSHTSELKSIELLDDGWVCYETVDESGTVVYKDGFRLIPLPEELKVLCRKYVTPLCHTNGNLFSIDWNTDDLANLRWEYLFIEVSAREGKELWEYGPEGTSADNPGPIPVPAADFEGLLMKYFPVTAELLRAVPVYDPGTQTYGLGYFQGTGGFASSVVEVTERVDNPDGSFTLRMDFQSMLFNGQRFRSFLTILPDEDGGYRYIGNRVDEEYNRAHQGEG